MQLIMKEINYTDIKVRGVLAHRAVKSYTRLESPYYRPNHIFKVNIGWPGDWEGRAILALVSLSLATKREPAFLESILDSLEKNLNEKGYMGDIYPDTEINEQQISGHNWLLKGLLIHYEKTSSERSLHIAKSIIENLYLPLKGRYYEYPSERPSHDNKGEAIGKTENYILNGWHISSDIGCAYMCLDGIAYSYKIFKTTQIKNLLDEMIESFINLDLLKLNMQTHATLTAVRGILCLYDLTMEEKYLEYAKNIFKLYTEYGQTLNFANLNWFCTPSWTEPCAIIDSYIIATRLFKFTNNISYLEMSHKIYFNALGYAQRPNGGFGCDACVVPSGDITALSGLGDEDKESYWCCTMRGGEGMAELFRSIAYYDQDTLTLCLYNDCQITKDNLLVTLKSKYPKEGIVRITACNTDTKEKYIKLYIPSYVNNYTITINNSKIESTVENGFITVIISKEACYEILLTFDIPLIKKDVDNQSYMLFHGYSILGIKNNDSLSIDHQCVTSLGKDRYIDKNSNLELSPLYDVFDMTKEDFLVDMRQIVFKNE